MFIKNRNQQLVDRAKGRQGKNDNAWFDVFSYLYFFVPFGCLTKFLKSKNRQG